jgi:hypothetical protein
MIGNLDPKLRSQIDNIQLLALIKDSDVNLRPITLELRKLETVGVDIENYGNIKASVVFICGDYLGSHQLGGFIENFSKPAYNCRYCSWHSSSLTAETFDLSITKVRTEQSYNENAKKAEISFVNSCGMKFKSIFNKLKHFHVL